MASLLEEAQELIEWSLEADIDKKEFDRKARVWLEKTKAAMHTHADHDHEPSTCSACGFDLACPSCGAV